MKKTLDSLGMIVAWLLSIVLVVMLLVTPIAFSALSLLNPQTITKVIANNFTDQQVEQPSAEQVEVVTLSDTILQAETTEEDLLAALFGDAIDQEQIDVILSTDVVKELVEAYLADLTDAFTGDGGERTLDAEKLKSIVREHIDEIVNAIQLTIPECAEMEREELKNNILKALEENAEEIIQALPDPYTMKQQLPQTDPALNMALKIVAMKDTIKLITIGVIVALSGLIFVCRLGGFKGFRWLAVDLFVAGGLNAVTCMGLLASTSGLGEVAKLSGERIASLVGLLLGAFTKGMATRTAVILVAGGGLLAAYILIKKQKEKKQTGEELQTQETYI